MFQEAQNAQPQFYGQKLPSYEPISTGLEDLLGHYGIRIKNEMVMDVNCYEQVNPPQQGGGKQSIYFLPRVLQDNINSKFIGMRNLKELYINRPASLEVDADVLKAQDIRSTLLFSSSPRSWTLKDKITLVPAYIIPPQDETKLKSYPLAYILEGKFKSYFADKELPQQPEETEETEESKTDTDDEKINKPTKPLQKNSLTVETKEFIKEGKPGKIFLMGTTGNIGKEILNEKGEFDNSPIRRANATFINNIIDYMSGRKDWALMRAKGSMRNPLIPYNKKSDSVFHKIFANRSFIKVVNMGVLPFVMILIGFGFYLQRRSKKKRLQALFGS